MALMDTVKQLMKGRSEVVERGIDTAVDRLGRYSDSLKKQAETLKERARTLDTERGGSTVAGSPADDSPPATPTAIPPTGTVDPPASTGLRGDLVDGDVPPLADPPPPPAPPA